MTPANECKVLSSNGSRAPRRARYLKLLLGATADIALLNSARLLFVLMNSLGRRFGLGLARQIVSVSRLLIPRLDSSVRRNLEIVFPLKTTAEREKIRLNSYGVLARNLLEFATVGDLNVEEVKAVCDGAEEAAAEVKRIMRRHSSGAMFLIPHFGSFELISQFWALLYGPTAILARAFHQRRFGTWWTKRRIMHGNRIFDRSGGFLSTVRALNRGENVALLFDQNVRPQHAVFVDLLGIPASIARTYGLAAIRTKCPIFFAALIQLPGGRYRLVAKQLRNPHADPISTAEKIERVSREANICLERLIEEYPEQWFWIHRRFKTRPPGEPETLYA